MFPVVQWRVVSKHWKGLQALTPTRTSQWLTSYFLDPPPDYWWKAASDSITPAVLCQYHWVPFSGTNHTVSWLAWVFNKSSVALLSKEQMLVLSNFVTCFCIAMLIMAALHSRCGRYILPCGFFYLLLSVFFLSLPNLSCSRLDVYHTSTHGVSLVRI